MEVVYSLVKKNVCWLILISVFFVKAKDLQAWALDKTFGDNGIVTTNLGINSGTFNDIVPSIHVKIQQDGKIIIVGDAYTKNALELSNTRSRIAVVRYNSDGSLDTTFGIKGAAILSISRFNSFGIDLALQQDGKIIVAGRRFERGIYFGDGIIARLNQDGSLDPSFGINGVVGEKNEGLNWSNFFRVKIDKDGKIIAAGNKGSCRRLNNPNPSDDTSFDKNYEHESSGFFVARYNADGSPDKGFGNNGQVKTALEVSSFPKPRIKGREGDEAYGLSIQQDGKIVLVGRVEDGSMLQYTDVNATNSTDCAIVSYDSNGKLDKTFGPDKNGMVVTSVSKHYNFFVDCIIQNDGKIVAIGVSRNTETKIDEFLVVRYLNDGRLDNSFGNNGIVLTSLGDGHAHAKNIILQEEGKILITGHVKLGEHYKFTLIRYNPNGSIDTKFGNNGVISVPINEFNDRSFAVVEQNDKKLLLVGDSFNGENYDFALVRLSSQYI